MKPSVIASWFRRHRERRRRDAIQILLWPLERFGRCAASQ
jgi:hypothetical protein